MIRKYPNLCKPIQIGRVTFRNRMFSAPMGGTDITNDGCIGPKSTAFFVLCGFGGAGADSQRVYGTSENRWLPCLSSGHIHPEFPGIRNLYCRRHPSSRSHTEY